MRGTWAEAQDAVERGDTRLGFLGKGAALMGGGAVLGAIPVALASAQGGLSRGDVKIVDYALTLEELEADEDGVEVSADQPVEALVEEICVVLDLPPTIG